jgi:hypothetical protein
MPDGEVRNSYSCRCGRVTSYSDTHLPRTHTRAKNRKNDCVARSLQYSGSDFISLLSKPPHQTHPKSPRIPQMAGAEIISVINIMLIEQVTAP